MVAVLDAYHISNSYPQLEGKEHVVISAAVPDERQHWHGVSASVSQVLDFFDAYYVISKLFLMRSRESPSGAMSI